ncbi:MAG: septal ring lytic transglycosylase RlpA family protein [Neomegalonema sp.]|nr:septal ring lytic transglycosylase RlpA family protein [Neomegalonema sp.]
MRPSALISALACAAALSACAASTKPTPTAPPAPALAAPKAKAPSPAPAPTPAAKVADRSDATCGLASWYGEKFRGRKTANGEIFDPDKLTAAHKTLAFGTVLIVEHEGAQVIVRINDRGPFIEGRVIDLSRAAAAKLGFIEKGVAEVCFAPEKPKA